MAVSKIGFTGTQQGMTDLQKETFAYLLRAISDRDNGTSTIEFHHGDCIGADTDAHRVVASIESVSIIIHPPKNASKRSYCNNYCKGERVTVLEEKEYLDGNKDIVDSCTYLYATPSGFNNELRSGTWSTIRYAAKKNKKIYIIYPDGRVVNYN